LLHGASCPDYGKGGTKSEAELNPGPRSARLRLLRNAAWLTAAARNPMSRLKVSRFQRHRDRFKPVLHAPSTIETAESCETICSKEVGTAAVLDDLSESAPSIVETECPSEASTQELGSSRDYPQTPGVLSTNVVPLLEPGSPPRMRHVQPLSPPSPLPPRTPDQFEVRVPREKHELQRMGGACAVRVDPELAFISTAMEAFQQRSTSTPRPKALVMESRKPWSDRRLARFPHQSARAPTLLAMPAPRGSKRGSGNTDQRHCKDGIGLAKAPSLM